mmetsp:Transcript_26376/g.61940  ORF Transcript_26376/g.61940 Transcript_26376/m.61940 type:complete len:265 (-) Transcript_26376:421-1215(-)
MVLSPELLSYAENIWQNFPDEFLTLGAEDFENEFQVGKQVERQLVVTESAVIIRIVIHRQPQAQLKGSPSPRFSEHSKMKARVAVQKQRQPQAPSRRSESQVLRSYQQPCLTEVFDTWKLTEVFNSKKRPQATGSAPKHTESAYCQREATSRAQMHAEPVPPHRQAVGTIRTRTEVVCQSKDPAWTLSPSSTTLSSSSISSPLGGHLAWTRQDTPSSWSDALSAVAMRRSMDHLAPVITRPPPVPSPWVVRAPAMDRFAPSCAA